MKSTIRIYQKVDKVITSRCGTMGGSDYVDTTFIQPPADSVFVLPRTEYTQQYDYSTAFAIGTDITLRISGNDAAQKHLFFCPVYRGDRDDYHNKLGYTYHVDGTIYQLYANSLPVLDYDTARKIFSNLELLFERPYIPHLKQFDLDTFVLTYHGTKKSSMPAYIPRYRVEKHTSRNDGRDITSHNHIQHIYAFIMFDADDYEFTNTEHVKFSVENDIVVVTVTCDDAYLLDFPSLCRDIHYGGGWIEGDCTAQAIACDFGRDSEVYRAAVDYLYTAEEWVDARDALEKELLWRGVDPPERQGGLGRQTANALYIYSKRVVPRHAFAQRILSALYRLEAVKIDDWLQSETEADYYLLADVQQTSLVECKTRRGDW